MHIDAITPSTGNKYIGNNRWGDYFDGSIDDVRFYSRALPASEILGINQNLWDLYKPVRPKIYPIAYIDPPAQIADAIIEMPRYRSSKPPTGSFK